MIEFSKIKELTLQGVKLKLLSISPKFTNQIKKATESDGTTIYNGGLGYIDGYRLSSSGELSIQSDTVTTGFIRCNSNSLIRLAGVTWEAAGGGNCYLSFYDSSFGLLGSINHYYSSDERTFVSTARGNVKIKTSSTDTAIISPTKQNNTLIFDHYTFKSDADKVAFFRINGVGKGADMMVSVDEEINLFQIWKGAATNWVKTAKDSDKTTIFNGGKGYIDGQRLSSSGSLKSQSNTVTTGFIKASKNNVVRMTGTQWNKSAGYNYFVMYDDNLNIIETINYDGTGNASTKGWSYSGKSKVNSNNTYVYVENGITRFQIVFNDSGLDYSWIRISAYGLGEDMVVTIDEEIK